MIRKHPRELVVATTNRKKKKELLGLLKGMNARLLTLADFKNAPKVREDKATFRENAIKKAVEISRFTGALTLAEDSGLEVAALDGLPGVRSARFAGPSKKDRANINKLLNMLRGVPFSKRKARFVCYAAIADKGRPIKTVSGIVSGFISRVPKGRFGFGYDPVFYYPALKKSFAQLPAAVKNKISHRAMALNKVKRILQEVL
ncbi:MAG: RdgB/HAM1 family non-canonical purine NTP pyrophosphatase [Candidatus Omnitrophica bacterium]|nr:RdgB/HAM1 family non-canonical purine NTP pyrophosphatase [Candidatus Omnitrophota bacterium]